MQGVRSGHMNHALKQMELLTKLALVFCANHVATDDVAYLSKYHKSSSVKQLLMAGTCIFHNISINTFILADSLVVFHVKLT